MQMQSQRPQSSTSGGRGRDSNPMLVVGELESDDDDAIFSREEVGEKLRASSSKIIALESRVSLHYRQHRSITVIIVVPCLYMYIYVCVSC